MAEFNGTSGADIYTGSALADTIVGNGGNDTLSGAGGNDKIEGNAGADTLNGGDDIDYIASADGGPTFGAFSTADVSLDTGAEQDTLNSGDGNDYLYAGYGDDVDGGAGVDTLSINFSGATGSVIADFSQTVLTIGGGTITNIESLGNVFGSAFGDTITIASTAGGSDAHTRVFGRGGDDRLVAGFYTSTLDGGDGNDIVDGRSSQFLDAVIGGSGNDTLYTSGNTFTLADGGAGNDTIYAHSEIHGGSGSDKIYVQAGSHAGDVFGDAGNDRIEASDGGTTMAGGAGADTLIGGQGGDAIWSAGVGSEFGPDLGTEHDVITAFEGNDEIHAGFGDDVDGGSGNDTLFLSLAGASTGLRIDTANLTTPAGATVGTGVIRNIEYLSLLTATKFADTITVGASAIQITVDAGAGNDVITTDGATAVVQGGAGNDRFVSGVAADVFDGGLGIDTIDYRQYGEAVTVTLGDDDTAGTGAGGDQLSSIEQVYGSGFDDHITGTDGRDKLYGFGGNDTIAGGIGNDFLDGGTGTDDLAGGLGNDSYVVDDTNDTVTENAGEGTDLVLASADYVLGANIEKLTLTGTGAIDGSGNDLANKIIGNAASNHLAGGGGNDQLDGAAGTDTMIGALGNDTFFVDNSGDAVSENSGEGFDQVFASASFVLGDNVENLILVDGSAAVDGEGNAIANTIIGNTASNHLSGGGGNDVLDGGAGADTLSGGTGDDTFIVDSMTDVVTENAGEGTDQVNAAVSFILGANVENLTLTGSGATDGSGNDGANRLTGNNASNYLSGGGGDDVLDGGQGADTLVGGLGNDTFRVDNAGDAITEKAGEGTDAVNSGTSFVLGANVENLVLTGTGATDGGGNDLANAITGNASANRLSGAGGNDTLRGNGGNDVLDGGTGTDTLIGGIGNDSYVIADGADTVVENEGEGKDSVTSTVSFTLATDMEVLTLGGTQAISGTGNAAINELYGNIAANTLIGLEGNDLLDGKGGIDLLDGGEGSDTYVIAAAGEHAAAEIADSGVVGTDIVRFAATSASTLAVFANDTGIERVILATGSVALGVDASQFGDNLLILGNAGDNAATGSAFADKIDGGAGADTLSGNAGDDQMFGGDGADRITGGIGRDTANGGNGADVFAFALADLAGSTENTADRISDFTRAQGDRIDLSQIDAGAASGDQAFAWIGTVAFSNTAGELRLSVLSGKSIVEGDIDGDAVADFAIRLDGVNTLQAADFIL